MYSSLKFIKNGLRLVMTKDRIHCFSVINTHKDIILDYGSTNNDFVTNIYEKYYSWILWSNLWNNTSVTHQFWKCLCKFYKFLHNFLRTLPVKESKLCVSVFLVAEHKCIFIKTVRKIFYFSKIWSKCWISVSHKVGLQLRQIILLYFLILYILLSQKFVFLVAYMFFIFYIYYNTLLITSMDIE